MCIKDFEQFNIRCDHRDQISLVFSFQFCRRQFPKRLKYLVTDQCQQFECNKMVTGLFCVSQDSAKNRKNSHTDK